MENNRPHVPKKEYIPMAHKLDIPQELNLQLRDAAEEIAGLTDNKSKRLNKIADLLHGLSEYRTIFDIGMLQVDGVKQSKATTKGKFTKRKEDDYNQYMELLNLKIFEEIKNLTEAPTRTKKVERLAEVYELCDALIGVYGIDKGKLESKVSLLNKNGAKKRTRRRKLSTTNN